MWHDQNIISEMERYGSQKCNSIIKKLLVIGYDSQSKVESQ